MGNGNSKRKNRHGFDYGDQLGHSKYEAEPGHNIYQSPVVEAQPKPKPKKTHSTMMASSSLAEELSVSGGKQFPAANPEVDYSEDEPCVACADLTMAAGGLPMPAPPISTTRNAVLASSSTDAFPMRVESGEQNTEPPPESAESGVRFDVESPEPPIGEQRRSSRLEVFLVRAAMKMKSQSMATFDKPSSTLGDQKLDDTLNSVAIALAYHIRSGEASSHQTIVPMFSEDLHPLFGLKSAAQARRSTPEQKLTGAHIGLIMPSASKKLSLHKNIVAFMRYLFVKARLSAETAVVVVVYIERLLSMSGVTLVRGSWRRAIMISVLLAAKAWEDEAVWNVDFVELLPDVDVKDVNALEKFVLQLLQYNVNVRASLYAKYYFDLRTLAETKQRQFTLAPLDDAAAKRLEERTLKHESELRRQGRSGELSSASDDALHRHAKNQLSTPNLAVNRVPGQPLQSPKHHNESSLGKMASTGGKSPPSRQESAASTHSSTVIKVTHVQSMSSASMESEEEDARASSQRRQHQDDDILIPSDTPPMTPGVPQEERRQEVPDKSPSALPPSISQEDWVDDKGGGLYQLKAPPAVPVHLGEAIAMASAPQPKHLFHERARASDGDMGSQQASDQGALSQVSSQFDSGDVDERIIGTLSP